jgi:hypothetical protein
MATVTLYNDSGECVHVGEDHQNFEQYKQRFPLTEPPKAAKDKPAEEPKPAKAKPAK